MQRDLLNPSHQQQKRTHKLKRLIPAPNSYFLQVKCPGCNSNIIIFSHAQSIIRCENCNTLLAKPTGGKCKLTRGVYFRIRGIDKLKT